MIEYNVKNFEPKRGAIYTLDIETTSLFEMEDGSYQIFDRSKKPDYYKGRMKLALPYIWMFGVNDTVYYGRDFRDLIYVFQQIRREDLMEIIWIHNLGFEFQFLRDIFEGMTVSKMIALAVRHPIAFNVDELNLQFRCTFKLTGMHLAKAAETYTDARKKTGDLDYNQIRTPRTPLTETEMGYCEYDIITLYKVVLYFKKKYKQLRWIPYTSTGEIRKAYKKRTTYHHRLWCARMCPDDLLYLKLIKAFQGGITHGNILYLCQIIQDVLSFDIASSYPYVMLTGKVPMGKFRPITPERALKLNRDTWAILFHVRFHGITSLKLNKYILNSKVQNPVNLRADNGRLVSADSIEMYLTDVDFDIINQDAYQIEKVEVLEAYCATKNYLPIPLQEYIISLFKAKTELRGIPEKAEDYRIAKTHINGLYGCSVTNILKSGCTFTKDMWEAPDLTLEYVHDKLEQVRTSKKQTFIYPWGVWITANARKRLWKVISELDDLVIYYDTDSIKCFEDPRVHITMERENQIVMHELQEMCTERGFNLDDCMPTQPNGKKCIIGIWDFEEKYKEFKTLGAKRYAYRSQDDSIHVTVSGVSKKNGYKALHGDLRKFRKNLIFDYDTADKLNSVYNDNQPAVIIRDKDGRVWKNVQKHGLALMPSTYDMTVQPELEAYMEEVQTFKNGGWIC